jgi:hypothetical protein
MMNGSTEFRRMRMGSFSISVVVVLVITSSRLRGGTSVSKVRIIEITSTRLLVDLVINLMGTNNFGGAIGCASWLWVFDEL